MSPCVGFATASPVSSGLLKDVFEELKALPRLDITFTDARHDVHHQDHRLVCELTWDT